MANPFEIVPEAALELAGGAAGEMNSMFTRRQKAMFILGAVICCGGIWGLSLLLGIPTYPGYALSILQQPSPAVAVLMIALGLAVFTLIGTMITARVRYDAGLWCAAIALVALSSRGGPVRYVLMSANGPGVYLKLAAEIILLAGCFALGVGVQHFLGMLGVL